MFENPGQKMKTWANAVFIIGLISSIVGGILVMAASSYSYYGSSNGEGFLSGLLVIVVGSLGSFLSALLLYALGTVVESAECMNAQLMNIQKTITEIHSAMQANAGDPTPQADKPGVPSVPPPKGNHQGSKEQAASIVPKEPAMSVHEENGRQYVIVDRKQPWIVCPVCQTSQRSDRSLCWHCNAVFVDQLPLNSPDDAPTPAPDNSALQVSVNRTGLRLRCPICGESQASNRVNCLRCKVQFIDTPK